MKDRLFEVFRDLVNRRDGELATLLGVSPVPVRHRAKASQDIPGLTHMVIINKEFDVTRADILEELQMMLSDPNCDKKKVLDKLSEKLSWEGIGELFCFLMQQDGSWDTVSRELKKKKWEDYSMEQPHYTIEVEKRKESGSNTIGDFDVNLIDGDGGKKTIKFDTQLDKVVYVWFLLHPRQQMTILNLWEVTQRKIDAQENDMIQMSRVLYSLLNKVVNSRIVENWTNFSNEFRKMKSRINKNVEDAWRELGGKGQPGWYWIEGTKDKNPNHKDSLYHVNLYSDHIVFNPVKRDFDDLTRFRMKAGHYPSVPEDKKKDKKK